MGDFLVWRLAPPLPELPSAPSAGGAGTGMTLCRKPLWNTLSRVEEEGPTPRRRGVAAGRRVRSACAPER